MHVDLLLAEPKSRRSVGGVDPFEVETTRVEVTRRLDRSDVSTRWSMRSIMAGTYAEDRRGDLIVLTLACTPCS
jgi:hypothetical protein